MNLMIYLFFLLIFVFCLEQVQILNSNKNPAKDLTLEKWMNNFEWGKTANQSQTTQLPQYKFYTDLIELILKFSRTHGGKYQESFLFIKDCLRVDRQFEKKLKELVVSSSLQMVLIILITWGFIFTVRSLSQVHINYSKLIAIGLWQLGGVMIMPLGIKMYRVKYFKDISTLWKFFHSLHCLIHVPLARSELFRIAGIQSLKSIKQKSLIFLVDKSFTVGEEAIKQGKNFEESVNSMMQELKFIEKWHFELFEKKIGVIKLVILAIFLLPSYLVFIFFILEHLMRLV